MKSRWEAYEGRLVQSHALVRELSPGRWRTWLIPRRYLISIVIVWLLLYDTVHESRCCGGL